MHKNTDVAFAQKTYTLFVILLNLMPKASKSAGGKTKDEILTESAFTFQKRKPKVFPVDVVARRYLIESKESMSAVLIREVIRYNWFLNTIYSTLTEVLRHSRASWL
ncbi:hypothetical protein HK405_005689 [Cladochytrium tenue]|nr:hypothetical protein HK405_005689 [Cladochytrium tenue]